MKKLVLITFAAFAFGLTSSSVSAQVSVELDFNYNTPGGDFADSYAGGVGVSIHPRFNISDQMAVGLNVGAGAFIGGDFQDPSSSITSEVSAAGVTSILGSFQYKFIDKRVAPYAELELGMFKYTAGSVDAGTVVSGNVAFEDTTYFGFAPKVGVMVGFLNIYAAYVAAGDLKYTQFGLGFRFGSK